MSIAHWINERRAREREKLRAEGYALGYDDAESGRPRRMGTNDAGNPEQRDPRELPQSEG